MRLSYVAVVSYDAKTVSRNVNFTTIFTTTRLSFQNTSEHFAIRFRQSYLIWKVCDVTAIELSSKE